MRKLTVRDMLVVRGAFNSWECVAVRRAEESEGMEIPRRVQRAIENAGDDPTKRPGGLVLFGHRIRDTDGGRASLIYDISFANKSDKNIVYRKETESFGIGAKLELSKLHPVNRSVDA